MNFDIFLGLATHFLAETFPELFEWFPRKCMIIVYLVPLDDRLGFIYNIFYSGTIQAWYKYIFHPTIPLIPLHVFYIFKKISSDIWNCFSLCIMSDFCNFLILRLHTQQRPFIPFYKLFISFRIHKKQECFILLYLYIWLYCIVQRECSETAYARINFKYL